MRFFLGSCNKMKNPPIFSCVTCYLHEFQQTDYTTAQHVSNSYTLSRNDQKMLHDCNLEPRTFIINFRIKSSLTTNGSPHFPQITKISLAIRSWYILSETFLTRRSKGRDEFSCIQLLHISYKQRTTQYYWEQLIFSENAMRYI